MNKEKSEDKSDEEFVDPDKNFLNQIIRGHSECRWIVHQNPNKVSIFDKRRVLMAFIAGLPNNEWRGALKEIYNGLAAGTIANPSNNPFAIYYRGLSKYRNLIDVFAAITDYCGAHYFKFFSYVKPKYGSDNLGVPEQ